MVTGLKDSTAEIAVKYGLKDEVLEKARKMCGKDFEDWECPEFEEVKKKLEKLERACKELAKYIGGEEKKSLLAKEKVFTIQLPKLQPKW